MIANSWLGACEIEAARLRAELKPYKDGIILYWRLGGVDKTAEHIAWIEADIAALDRHMSRLRQTH